MSVRTSIIALARLQTGSITQTVRRHGMKRIALLLIAVAGVASMVAVAVPRLNSPTKPPPRSPGANSQAATVTGVGSPSPTRKAISKASALSWATTSRSRPTAQRLFPSPTAHHRRFALPSHAVGGEQQGLRPRAIVRRWPAHERSIHGQGLEKIRFHRWLGFLPLQQRRQTLNRPNEGPELL